MEKLRAVKAIADSKAELRQFSKLLVLAILNPTDSTIKAQALPKDLIQRCKANQFLLDNLPDGGQSLVISILQKLVARSPSIQQAANLPAQYGPSEVLKSTRKLMALAAGEQVQTRA